MCEAVEKYADRRAARTAIATKIEDVTNLMMNMKISLEQALDALSITGDDRELITARLSK